MRVANSSQIPCFGPRALTSYSAPPSFARALCGPHSSAKAPRRLLFLPISFSTCQRALPRLSAASTGLCQGFLERSTELVFPLPRTFYQVSLSAAPSFAEVLCVPSKSSAKALCSSRPLASPRAQELCQGPATFTKLCRCFARPPAAL